jgi:hypothetical protein
VKVFIVSSIGPNQSARHAHDRTAAVELSTKFVASLPHCARPVAMRMPHSAAGLHPGS